MHPWSMTRGQRWLGGVFLTLLLVSTIPVVFAADGRRNLHVLQAQAFLHGRLHVDEAEVVYPYDLSTFEGRRYVAFPPGPAALVLPVVAAFGAKATNTPLIALALTALVVVLLRNILRRLAVPERLHLWVAGAFVLGTPYWFVLTRSRDVWFFAQVVAVAFQMLALHEALGRRRAWLAGLYLGVATLSRQLSIFTGVVVAIALLEEEIRERRAFTAWVPKLAALGATAGACIGALLVLNHLRFGSPFEDGYRYMNLPGWLGERGRWFSGAYVPFNLYYLLLAGLHVDFDSPDKLTRMVYDPFGTGILTASPFVLLAAYADQSRQLVKATWVAVALSLAVQLAYICNGAVQINAQRYTLDFWPALTLAVALGLARRAEDGEERLWLGAVGWAVGLNAFAISLRVLNPALDWYVRLFPRG